MKGTTMNANQQPGQYPTYGYTQPAGYTPPPAPKKGKGKKIAAWTGGAFVALVAVSAIAGGNSDTTEPVAVAAPTSAALDTVAAPAPKWTAPAPTTKYTAPVAKLDPLNDDGLWFVGSDIQPGVYSVTMRSDSYLGYWARCATVNCDPGPGMNANGLVSEGERAVLEILPSDFAVDLQGLTLVPR